MPDNPNASLEHANAAAAAVDPNSPEQQAIIARATHVRGASYADRLMGKGGEATASDVGFLEGLEKANAAKEKLAGAVPGSESNIGDEDDSASTASQQPATPRKLTDPPVAPRQRSNFRKLEAERDALRVKLKALEGDGGVRSSGAEASGAGPVGSPQPAFSPEAFTALSKERDDLLGELSALDITRSPEFSARFEQPRAVTIRQAKNLAGDKGQAVETILSMPPGSLRDAKLDELLTELPSSTASVVRAANNKLAELEFNRGVEIETQRATAGDRLKEKARRAEHDARLRSAEFDSLLNEWRGAIDQLDATKSKEAPALIQQARDFYEGGKLSHKERAAMALQSALVPGLLAEQADLMAEVERLQRQLSRFVGGLPGGGSEQPDEDTPAASATPQQRDSEFAKGLQKAIRSDPTFAAVRRHRGGY